MMRPLSFPCNACGACCKQIGLNEAMKHFNRGDGICRHFDDTTNLCTIYEHRPLICRVEEYYKTHFSEQFEWAEFVKLNLEVCEKLQENTGYKK